MVHDSEHNAAMTDYSQERELLQKEIFGNRNKSLASKGALIKGNRFYKPGGLSFADFSKVLSRHPQFGKVSAREQRNLFDQCDVRGTGKVEVSTPGKLIKDAQVRTATQLDSLLESKGLSNYHSLTLAQKEERKDIRQKATNRMMGQVSKMIPTNSYAERRVESGSSAASATGDSRFRDEGLSSSVHNEMRQQADDVKRWVANLQSALRGIGNQQARGPHSQWASIFAEADRGRAGWLDTAGLFLRFLGHDAVAPGLHSQGVLAGDGTYTAGNGNALLVAVAGAQGPRRVTLAQLECFIGVPKGESHSNCTITH
jgi:hypothetical protein